MQAAVVESFIIWNLGKTKQEQWNLLLFTNKYQNINWLF